MNTSDTVAQQQDATSLRAELLRRRLAGGQGGGRRKGIGRADRTAPLPLSFGQQQMWFLNRMDPESTEYGVPLVLRLAGELNSAALESAWEQIVERHEILRTRYLLVGGEPAQVVDAPRPAGLPVVDLTVVPAEALDARWREAVELEIAKPFDLEQEWPVRATLVRLSATEHVLAVVFHHIACDAWSMRVFAGELGGFYRSAVTGGPMTAEPLALQYADYAAWQRKHLAGDTLERELSYWRDKLDAVMPLDLSTDRPRPAVRSWAGDSVPFAIPAQLADRVRELSAEQGTTPFTFLLTVYQLMLGRHAGSSDITVGVTVSARNRPELQQIIGYGINTLAIRGRWSGDPAFAELLKSSAGTVLDALDHQSVPFARLVDELQPQRDLSRTPVFQVDFVLHEDRESAFDLHGLELESLAEDRIAKFDLTLNVTHAAEGAMHARLGFATSLFDRATVERMAGHILQLLESVTVRPQARLSSLRMLPAVEVARLMGEWNPVVPEPVERCVHEVFEAQAERTPDAVAVVFEGVELTYRELNERANRIAHHLRELGAGPDRLVGVSLERGLDLLPALLGVLKSGAAYLPLDPANPVERLGYILEDAGASLLVTMSGLESVPADYAGTRVLLDADAAAIAERSSENPAVVGSPENLIYVIYTSGSTGRPKGVALSHANVLRLLRSADHNLAFSSEDVWTLFHSYAFDVSVWEMWGALLNGGRLVVASFDTLRSPDEFLDLLVAERVSVLCQTPTAFRSLTALAAAGDPRIDELGLRAVVFAGERLETGDLLPWTDRLGLSGPVLVNMYGITETTVHSTYHELGELDLAQPNRSFVGRPLSDLAIHLLDEQGNLVPVGVPGEIYVGGAGVARGYLGRPELTAERFVPDPFGPPGARLYRSGDLARRLEDGSLECLGRIDTQVKIRGYRIELGEITNQLHTHTSVRDAAVIAREDVPGDKTLAAYIVTTEDTSLEPAELRAHLSAALPSYMVPSAFVAIDRIPLTSNGKLDARALPAPGRSAYVTVAHVAPRTAVELAMAAAWAEVLRMDVDRVGVHDSFFDLGGDSIRAVALTGALREAGYGVSIRDVFEYRTIARLAANAGFAGEAFVPVAPFALIGAEDREALPVDVVDAYPLSQVQTGMLVETLTSAERGTYININSFRIPDEQAFSPAALREALRVVVQRHDILRTSMHLEGYTQPLQLVHADVDVPVTVHDLCGMGEEDVRQAQLEFVTAQRAELFDVAAAPLLRVSVHVESDAAWRLTLTQSHAITEGWSLNSLTMELLDAYRAIRDGVAPPEYPELAVRYADFIAAESESLESADDQEFWKNITDQHAPLTLPEAWAGTVTEAPAETLRVEAVLADLEEQLRALASRAGASLKTVLLAAHLKVMSALTTETAFHAGLVTHGRLEVPGAERVLGMHLNTLPIPFRHTATTWLELVEQTYASETAIWGHRRHPLPAIQRAAGADRLITVLFDYHDFHQVDADKIDTTGTIGGALNEFALNAIAQNGRIHLTATTRTLTREAAERLAGMFRQVLESMAADVHGDATGGVVPAGEAARLVGEWNPVVAVPVDGCVHQAFEAQVERTPDAVAVVFEGVELTYRELNGRANRIAHHLRELGAGPDQLVGVSLERGLDLLPALLGVLKSGAAYLPLDPANPADRLGYILEDAGASLLVTTSAVESVPERFAGTRVLLDADAAAIAERSSENPVLVGSPENLIYVIYTSGSTGKPKGVGLSHANVLRLFASTEGQFGFGAGDVWTLFHSYAFDFSVWEIWGPLLLGGRLVVVPHTVSRSPAAFLDLLVREQVTVLNQTPSAFYQLIDADRDSDLAPDALALRHVVFGGEALDPLRLRPWFDRHTVNAPVLSNMYGITETTVHSTYQEHGAIDPAGSARSRIGRPLSDLAVHLLDARGNLVPVGVPGEIYVGGAGVARGYLGRPELTAERFVPDPFGPAGSRLYRSGDLARRLEDGSLEFLGRIDTQVKIRGYRIELGEITNQLRTHASVRDAAVIAREDSPGHRSLAAYVVLDGGAVLEPAELRAHLAGSLPEYMVPGAFVAIERIPLTANGKLDVRALPAPGRDAFAGGGHVAPRTVVEVAMAGAWADVLGLELDGIGVHDSFFDLGGDSIRAVALAGALREAGYGVSIRDVFEYRTIARLAANAGFAGEAFVPVAPFALIGAEDRAALPAGVVDAYPLSQVQTGMLVETLTSAERRSYHNLNSFRIPDEEPFSAEALREALRVVVQRHDILRTSMHLDGFSRPLQIVHSSVEMPLTVHDLRGMDAEARDRAGAEFADQQRADLFDPAVAPLVRASVHLESERAWRLTFTQSHAITEGWSYNSMLMEILDAYRAVRDGEQQPAYDAPVVRYADYIAAELESLDSAEDRAYWKGVTDAHVPFTVPETWGDQDSPAERYRVPVRFTDIEDGLRALATQAGASLKTVLLAAHLKVLSSLTTETAFHTGLVTHGRLEVPGAEKVLGMHLNTLPIGFTTGSARTWVQLVQNTYARELEAWGTRRYPLPAIQRDTGSQQRLIPVMFDFIDFHHVDTDKVDVRATLIDGATEFELHISGTPDAVNIIGATSVVSRVNAERLAGMYRQALESMAADVHGDATCGVVPAVEVERLAGEWNPVVPEPVERCVHEVFEARAARTPDAVAVVFEGVELSYRELNERANRIAHHLRELGAGPDRLVGVSLERGLDLLPALLGVLKSGAAYLPLDPANPVERLGYILEDAGASLLVTMSGLESVPADYAGTRVLLDADAAVIASRPSVNPVPVASPENLIYVIYTSGSTGRPKGVALSHANVLRLLLSADHDFTFSSDDVWTLFHSYAFDVSVWEMWGALLHGGRLVVASFDTLRSPDEFLDLLVAERVSVLCQTPTAFRSLTALAAAGDPRIDELGLRAVVFAGERLETGDLLPWTDRLGLSGPVLVNMYGITETTVHSTYHELGELDLAQPNRSFVGRPLSDLAIHLLDEQGNLVPVGVPGEIYVGGAGVARGYLGRPELTAERFVPDPFGPPGARLYRSGDLARRLEDGSLECLGRIDTQVKIRGYRIELGEITNQLRTHTSVRDAAVIAREDIPGDKTLAAYVVLADDAALDPIELRAHLAAALPDYMVPGAFVAIDRIPLTSNGKLDARALPAPDRKALASTQLVAPRTPVEQDIARAWAEVLRMDAEQVSVHDSFFDLGGDSIRAVRLTGALRELGHVLTIRDIFEHRTIARLALCAVPGSGATAFVPVAPFELIDATDRAALPTGVVDAYPLSQVQTGMLVEMLTSAERGTYININSFRIPDDQAFSPAALEAALRAVVQRHDILRTSMHLDGYSEPLQLVHAEVDVPVAVHDLRGMDEATQRESELAWAGAERARGLDMASAPLLRVTVHLESDAAWRLTLTQSHAITEGWSLNSLTMELLTAYRAIRDGAELPAHETAGVRYADFVAAELVSLESEEDRSYWKGITDGHTPFVLPQAWGSDEGADPLRVTAEYGDLEDGLRALARRAGASLKTVLLAAHLTVLSSLTTESAFHTGLVTHGRLEVPGAEHVLGMHLNTLPIAFRAGSATTWVETVRQVFARETEIWGHRRHPLPAIQRASGAERLITVLFDYLDFHQVDDGKIDRAGTIGGAVNEFALNAIAQNGGIHLTATTRTLTHESAQRLAAMYRTVLEAMAADPEGSALDGAVPAAEETALLALGTAPSAAEQPLTLDQFEAQAAATPGAIAVTFGDQELTYAELDERANAIAHQLLALGAGPDIPVGVLLTRSTDLIAGLLAAWKAGSPYLPLDPKLPAERLAHILADTAAPLVITTTGQLGLLAGVFQGRLVLLDEPLDTHPATTTPARSTQPDNLAYIIYTSGSTGTPKGVMAHHGGLANYLAFTKATYATTPGGAPLFSPITFDLGIPNIFTPLVTGQPVHLLAHDLDTADLAQALSARAPYSFIKLTPAHLELLTHQLSAEQASTLAGQVIAAGDTFTTELAERWRTLAGTETVLATEYGPTEITVGNSGQVATSELSTIPLGEPIPNTAMHVLDAFGALAPVGVPGEVHISGAGVTRGYLNRPDLTAKKFIPNPYGPAGSRLYRTGDLARRLADGSLEFLGRIDTQVKINGYRIELGEITNQLRHLDGVEDAVVIARDNTLLAYLIGTTPDTVREDLAAVLPDYMIPNAFLTLDRIPLTNNGKLDTKALPTPGRDALAGTGRAAPRTATERQYAQVWADVLGLDVETISTADSFFDLGGDSIRAVRLAGALREHGYDLTIRDIFAHRTIAALAANTVAGAAIQPFRSVEPFTLISPEDRAALPAGIDDAYPLSQIQTGMLVEMLADEEKRNYLDVSFYRIPDPKPFSPDALRRAADAVVARHDILRTSTHLTDYSQPLQLVHTTVDIPITTQDLRHLDEQGQLEFGLKVLADERAAGFDIATAPLLRISAYVEADDAWRLSFTHCHAVTEGWSMHSLTMELLAAYRAIRDGEPLPAYDAPAVRYADYIAAELESLDSPEDRAYWQQITDTHTPITLPQAWADADKPREAHRAEVRYSDIEDDLRALAARAGASLKSVFLAAHLKVMSAVTTDDAFHTGLVVHGRLEAPGAEGVLGMHLNTLPVAFKCSTIPRTWRELVEQTFARETEIWGHRRYPLPSVQRAAGAERLISVIFEYLDFHQMDGDQVDVEAEFHAAPNEFALNVSAIGGRISLATGTDVLTREAATRLAAMYRTVLAAMAADAEGDATASAIPADEQARLLALGTAVERPVADLVIDRFEGQVAVTPAAVAVVFGEQRMSYRELDGRANRIARELASLGVNGPVGIYLERSTDMVAGLLAAWKAGAAYLPLDPKLPAERLTHILTDTAAQVVLTTSALASTLPETGARLVLLDTVDGSEATAPKRSIHPLDVAYVIYTSGSTGTPKGVLAHHEGLANYLAFTAATYATAPGGAPLFSPITFDLGIPNIFTPLVTGQPVHLLAHDLDTADLGAALAAGAPYSFIKLTPAHLELLTHQLSAEQASTLAGQVIAAGDTFTTDLAERWRRLAGTETVLATEYGPTEITVGNSGQVATSELSTIPLGEPIPNTAMHVLDAFGALAPVGVPGEVHISGAGVTRGYLNRPDLTAEKFIPNPYGPAGSRLYRTGDLARRLADGSLEFLGRIDTQVKINGYRIELGEITSQLRHLDGVEDAVVIARDNTLLAYLVGTTPDTTPDTVREDLAAVLPDYMIPSAFLTIDRIPLTNNGKLDTKALPLPGHDAYASAEHVAPTTDTEKLFAAAWADVLGLDPDTISTADSFFDLGGDSIRAVRLTGALRESGHNLTIRDIFQHRTIAALAANSTAGDAEMQPFRSVEPFTLISPEDRAALPAGIDDAYPLSQIQTGMLVEMLADTERGGYHHLNSFRIPDPKPFAPDALREALRIVVARHDILRSSLHLMGYLQPLQLVHHVVEMPLALHDLRGLDADQLDRARADFAAQQLAELFDPAVAPLVRASVHLESDQAWRLTFTQNHAITEGWSYHSMLMEILDAYQAIRDGEPLPVYDAPAVRYADYVAAELDSLDSTEEREYWRSVTDSHVPFTLPEIWGDQDGPVERYRRRVEFGDLDEQLRSLATRAGASLKTVLLAAHLTVLSALTPEESFHTGLVTHGRLEVPGAERVMGMHLNTLPIGFTTGCTTGSGSARTWLQLVQDTYAREVDAWSHRRYPLPAIQRDTGSAQRLISVMFDYTDFHHVDTDRVDIGASMVDGANEFQLHVSGATDGLSVFGATDTLSHDYAERLCGMYRRVLECMAADPYGSAAGGVLPAAEQARVLLAGSGTRQPQPVELTVHEAFQQRALATPDAIAVVAGRNQLTYRQLNERANRIAHHLRALGAGPETLVGLCLDRGPDLLPALLGVLKSGAAYVSLDPANPMGRLALILADTNAPVVLTTSGHAAELAEFCDGELVVLDRESDRSAIAAQPSTDPVNWTSPANLAYVLYTSGSTGTPKGAALTHANVMRLFRTSEREFTFRESDIWAMFHSYAFDVSVWEMWGALLHGGRLVVIAPEIARSPEDFLDVLVAERITVLCQTPTAFRGLAALANDEDENEANDEANDEGDRLARLSLRAVVFAGERLDVSELLPWVRRLGLEQPALLNMYGITETSVYSLRHELGEQDLGRPLASIIGTPLGDQKIHVLDRRGNLVPVGVPGEIYIGGPAVARGYRGRPDLTAERFVPDPYGEPGARLYRTGDLARLLPDGTLEFLGRIDTQVKIRGYRIELGEIQSRLRRLPQVRDAVVIAREDVPGDRTLAAYVVADGESAPEAAELRAALAAELPAYMVPSAFVAIDRVPLTPNGKLDHRALPAPDRNALVGAQRIAPRNATEQRTARVWAEILQRDVDRVGVEDNFFDLGGHSLLATQLVFALRTEFAVELPLKALFEYPTVAGLAAAVDRCQGGAQAVLDTDVDPADLRLAEDITGVGFTVHAGPLRRVLLTGATGFLGAYLLAELIRSTDATVDCLVRAGSDQAAEQRLRSVLERYELWSPQLAARTVAVAGDLALPRFGLTDRHFDELAARTDAVYHSGAAVNVTQPYPELRPANVAGTEEILRLAARSGRAAVHHISTIGVFAPGGPGERVITEESPTGPSERLRQGYPRSKWVAEQLVLEAARRGLATACHRPGRISGAASTGACQTDDAIWRFVKGCVQAGAVPEAADVPLDLIPVDYVAAAVVALSRRLPADGDTGPLHYTSPHPLRMGAVVEQLRAAGYPLRPLPLGEWSALVAADPGNVASPLLGVVGEAASGADTAVTRFDSGGTAAKLAAAGISCPPVAGALLDRQLAWFARTGYLPPATAPAPGLVDA